MESLVFIPTGRPSTPRTCWFPGTWKKGRDEGRRNQEKVLRRRKGKRGPKSLQETPAQLIVRVLQPDQTVTLIPARVLTPTWLLDQFRKQVMPHTAQTLNPVQIMTPLIPPPLLQSRKAAQCLFFTAITTCSSRGSWSCCVVRYLESRCRAATTTRETGALY